MCFFFCENACMPLRERIRPYELPLVEVCFLISIAEALKILASKRISIIDKIYELNNIHTSIAKDTLLWKKVTVS